MSLNMISYRKDSRVTRKFTLSNGVLCEQVYIEDKCMLRINVVMASGEFEIFSNSLNLNDFHDELSICLSVIGELLAEEHQGE